MPPPRRLSPHRNELRSDSQRSSFQGSWFPREQRMSRSPQRARFSRSPRRHSPSSYRSRSPGMRSPDASQDWGYPLKRRADSAPRHDYRSRSPSPLQAKRFREMQYSPVDEARRHYIDRPSRSPRPHRSPSPYDSKMYGDQPLTSRRHDVKHIEIDCVTIVDRGPKMEKLNKRFQTLEQVAQAPFDFEENISIGIQRGPSHIATNQDVNIPVNYEFNPKTFAMIFPKSDYVKCIFDRDEIKAFHHDDILDEEGYVEKRTITVTPVDRPRHSRYDDELNYKITFGTDRDDEHMVHDFRSRTHRSRSSGYSDDVPVTVRLDPKPDPRYERVYREHCDRYEDRSVSRERIHRNLDDPPYNRICRSDEGDSRRRDSRDWDHGDRDLREWDHNDWDPRDWDHKDQDPRDWDHREWEQRDRYLKDGERRDKVSRDRELRWDTRRRRDDFSEDRYTSPPREDRYHQPRSAPSDLPTVFLQHSDQSFMVDKIYKKSTKSKFTGTPLVKPKVWIIGSSVIKDIQKFFAEHPELELQKQLTDIVSQVHYHGVDDMKVQDLLPAVKYMITLHDLPQMIIFQCGEHNVCIGRNIDLLNSMKKDLLSMKADIPNVKLVWGQMLPPWMENKFNGKTLAKSRRRINRFMMQCFLSEEIGGAFLYHSQFRTNNRNFLLQSTDGYLHLNKLGMETLLMQLKMGIKYFCTGHGSIFPYLNWPPEVISLIEPECISMLDKEHIQDITEEQLNYLTREQIQQFSNDQINMFHYTQLPWLFCKHFIQNLSPVQINCLTKQNLMHVTAKQLEFFTVDQEKWLTQEVKAYIESKKTRMANKMKALAAKEVEPKELEDKSSSECSFSLESVSSKSELGNSINGRFRNRSLSNESDGGTRIDGPLPPNGPILAAPASFPMPPGGTRIDGPLPPNGPILAPPASFLMPPGIATVVPPFVPIMPPGVPFVAPVPYSFMPPGIFPPPARTFPPPARTFPPLAGIWVPNQQPFAKNTPVKPTEKNWGEGPVSGQSSVNTSNLKSLS